MYQVVSRNSGQKVATFQTSPYQYDVIAGAGAAVETVLADVEDLDQMNRTTFDGEPAFKPSPYAPDDVKSTAGDGGTSMETPQDPSQDHIVATIARRLRTGYIVIDSEDAVQKAAEAANRYSEGDKVEVSGQKGVVTEVWTQGSDREGPDGDTWNPSDDSPVYIVATVDGAVAATASDIEASDWSTDQDDPAGDLAQQAKAADVDWDDSDDVDLKAALKASRFEYPESWKESDVPARLILLDAWASMGGKFNCGGGCCHGEMTSSGMSDDAANEFCASMKDRVLGGWEGWRKGG